MSEIINTPFFGLIITCLSYILFSNLYRKSKNFPLFNPVLLSTIFISIFLEFFKISYDSYMVGGNLIFFALGPATVVLAIPLYQQKDLLKSHGPIIITGVVVGSIAGIFSIIGLGLLLDLPVEFTLSLVPKSVTTPIGIEVSKQIGGINGITVVAIIITGIIGAIFGPFILKILKINSKIAKGAAIGTSSHALGTTKAFELGEVEGAISSLCIGLAGIVTVVIAPILVHLLIKF